MIEYLPWWLGGIALATLTVGFWYILQRPLGVSGAWARVVMWRHDKAIERAEAPFRANPEMLKDALMAATVEAFGEQAVQEALARRHQTASPKVPVAGSGAMPHRTPWTAHLVFLVMMAAGGLLTSAATGQYEPRIDLGELHRSLFGGGMSYWLTLIVGGALVGFGTQWANGCTSGHALSGASRLAPASLIATATFFASAVAVSFLLHVAGGM
ncbi:MAG: YeeE/YedE family protein [Gammaproteobacteria bacterium]|nr:YeeE/YedE family protein [Gammaproteobacteria bacterium]